MQGMQPHNLQEQTQSSRSRFQDFQTRNVDQPQKIPEMWEMLGLAAKQCKKPELLNISKKQPSNPILAPPPPYTLKIDFQKHGNAGDVSQ